MDHTFPLDPVAVIGETGDVIFLEVLPYLDLYDLQGYLAGIGQAVPGCCRHKGALTLAEVDGAITEDDIGHAAHHDPVLTPVVVHLQRELLSGFHRHSLDAEEPGPLELCV